MNRWAMRLMISASLLVCVNVQAANAGASWYAQTSAYTRHFSPDPRHNNQQNLLGLERHDETGRLFGGASFLNSFGQRSTYGYYGQRYDLGQSPAFFKLTAGLLHGYRGEFRHKIPLNHLGLAPAMIPSAGLRHGDLAAEIVLLGVAATMINIGVRY